MKKYVDADKLIQATIEIPQELWQYEETMREIPNFDKTEGAKRIYSRKEYAILAVKKGYIVCNTTRPFEKSHTHLRSFNIAKTIIENCINKRTPKTNNLYLLESHIRISTDKKYIKLVEELIEAKKSKDKLKYRNKNMNSKKK